MINQPAAPSANAKRRIAWASAVAQSAVLLDRVRNKYSEDEPRDEGGRWTDGGGGGGDSGSGGGGSGSGMKDVHPHLAADKTSASSLRKPEDAKVESLIAKVPGADKHVRDTKEKLAKTVATDSLVSKGGYKLPNGRWTPAREQLHRDMIAQTLTPERVAAATSMAGEQPVLHLLGGRGGSGKSWFTGERGTIPKGPLYINNDDFKAMLPEFQGWNAPNVHEESSGVGDAAEKIARDQKLNVIIDGTMKSGDTLNKRIDAFKQAGYRIEGHYMYTSPAKAAQRALERFTRGMEKNGQGRYVAPEYSMGSTSNEKSFDEARAKMDKWEIYDNNVDGREPQFHSRGGK